MSSSNCSRCNMVILDGECSVCRGAVDWPAFWRSLPPRELLAALDATSEAPKVAGPWRRAKEPSYNGHTYEWRMGYDRGQSDVAAWVGPLSGDPLDDDPNKYHPDRASADAALRAADWILVDEETTK